MDWCTKKAEEVLEQLDTKLDEVEELIRDLPLKDVVKDALVDRLYDMWTEIEDNLDMTPTDMEYRR